MGTRFGVVGVVAVLLSGCITPATKGPVLIANPYVDEDLRELCQEKRDDLVVSMNRAYFWSIALQSFAAALSAAGVANQAMDYGGSDREERYQRNATAILTVTSSLALAIGATMQLGAIGNFAGEELSRMDRAVAEANVLFSAGQRQEADDALRYACGDKRSAEVVIQEAAPAPAGEEAPEPDEAPEE